MIEARTMGLFEAIYTFVDAETGENVSIASAQLTAWVNTEVHAGRLEVCLVPVEASIVKKFIQENSVSCVWCEQMLKGMCTLEALDQVPPIVFCEDGRFTDGRPDVMLVDGHHRYVCFAAMGQPFIHAVVLMKEQWERFKIVGLPDVSAQELRASPVVKVIEG